MEKGPVNADQIYSFTLWNGGLLSKGGHNGLIRPFSGSRFSNILSRYFLEPFLPREKK